jgi:hypothetical protein
MRQQSAAQAEQKAMDALDREVGALEAQGQILRWNWFRNRYWCDTQPWTGGQVNFLTDACEDDVGFVPPFPSTPPPIPTEEFHNTIVSVTGTPPSLDQLPTVSRQVGSIVKIIIIPTGSTTYERQEWWLQPGAAQIGNPGEVNPLDRDSIANNKHWVRIA